MRYTYLACALFLFGLLNTVGLKCQNLPEGWSNQLAFNQFDVPGGILHTDTELALVWELPGRVWLVEGEEVHPEPIIDITEEVAFWGDHGMIGAAIHPDFINNGYIYLLYSTDRHHYKNFGTPSYDPAASEIFTASMGRLTRYTLNTVDFTTIIPNSRKVLIGDTVGTGIPICAPSHGVGSVVFGEDGSLLVSTGDGNTWVGVSQTQGFAGQTDDLPEFAYDDVALEDGVISEDEYLGAYRAQYLDGLNGKILRLDPETGEGLPNNPFFDDENPDSPRSKVYGLGFRNPYRMTIKPGTGSGGLEDGFPGIIYITDVGDWVWEEINVVREPGLNFGWPMFQGTEYHDYYYSVRAPNSNAPNPLYETNGCDSEFFSYQNTVKQANQFHEYFYSNPCNTSELIPDDIVTFAHELPAFAYANTANEDTPFAVVPSWNSQGDASYTRIADAGIEGDDFTGISGSGGVFVNSDSVPSEFNGLYLMADFSGWFKAFHFNESEEMTQVDTWSDFIGAPIHITQNPSDGCVYFTSLSPVEIRKLCFGGNIKPVIIATPEIAFGASPLEVDFDASESYDPEGDVLNFQWDFGDGTTSDTPSPTHVFEASTPNAIEQFETVLTVSDSEGATSTISIPISLNNTPPEANIISINEGDLYSVKSPTTFNLTASVIDAESNMAEMQYDWQLKLNHNTHSHNLDTRNGNNQNLLIYPTGCSQNETYWYEIELVVTDPGGLKSTDSRNIYPDCEGVLDETGDDGLFTFSPNPFSNRLEMLSSIDLGDEVVYFLYDAAGKQIAQGSIPVYNGRRFLRFNFPSIEGGMYILKLRINGEWYQERIMKIDY